ncbi:MAG: sterol desaturase family protein [Bacteroidia bacterium]|nr:sterol desaturase family protein [Bacteroidia bacterium]MDW8235012.1 sterol desaturase family protein [Bacteroidia bacterium]
MRYLRAYRVLLPPLVVYGGAVGVSLVWSLMHYSIGWVGLMAVGGWFFWTLVEYLIHRFGFHEEPGRPWAQKYDIHWIHHRQPHRSEHIVTSLSLTVPVALIFFGVFYLIGAGSPLVGAWYAGFGIGYLSYEMIHLMIHIHPIPPLRWLRSLWMHHYHHHFRSPNKYYGVTSRWWDYLFGTI